MRFKEYLTENALVNIDRIAMQLQQNITQNPQLLKQQLAQLMQAMEMENMEANPYYLHAASVIRDDMLPVISQNPTFRHEAEMLDALTSSYVSP